MATRRGVLRGTDETIQACSCGFHDTEAPALRHEQFSLMFHGLPSGSKMDKLRDHVLLDNGGQRLQRRQLHPRGTDAKPLYHSWTIQSLKDRSSLHRCVGYRSARCCGEGRGGKQMLTGHSGLVVIHQQCGSNGRGKVFVGQPCFEADVLVMCQVVAQI